MKPIKLFDDFLNMHASVHHMSREQFTATYLSEDVVSEKREDVGKYNTVKKVIAKLGRRPSEQDLATFINNNYYDVTEVERGEDDPSANDKIADLVAFYKFDIEEWEIAWFDAQNESVVNEAENYITDVFKVGDKIKTNFGEWEVIETDYAPNKSFIGSFIFKGKDMARVNIPNPPKTNKNAVGYKVTDGAKYPTIGFLYQYKDITKLVTVGVDESVVTERKTISSSKISMMGAKILSKLSIGTIFDTEDGEYEITDYGRQANAFKEFEAEHNGKKVKVKLTAMYGVTLEVTDDVRSARFNKEVRLNSIILESVTENRELMKIDSYLNTKDESVLIDFLDDAYGNSDDRKTRKEWNDARKDLSYNELVDYAVAHAENFGMDLQDIEDAIEVYESVVTEAKNSKEIKELEELLKSIKSNTPAAQGRKAAIQDDIERLKNESVVTEAKPAGLSKKETLKVAQKFADALTKLDGMKYTVSSDYEEDSFDLDIEDQDDVDPRITGEYAGGSYNINADGSVVNMAVSNKKNSSPVYGNIDDDIKTIIKTIKNIKESLLAESTVNEAVAKNTKIYQIATPAPKSMLVEELEDLFGDDYRHIITEFDDDEGYESVLVFNLTKSDIKRIQEEIGDVLIWEYSIKKGKAIS